MEICVYPKHGEHHKKYEFCGMNSGIIRLNMVVEVVEVYKILQEENVE